ncbi:berberine bridge enzyme-like 22 [Iris pallida]|uniref:Berberine bridge enzyme-like 22 n=1 Tax=Iris pallida TaxID=29817 RepID=A0AAX6HSU2_IRIPA|nr:berberine bridge enzyme-like 22 [Iris pallida]
MARNITSLVSPMAMILLFLSFLVLTTTSSSSVQSSFVQCFLKETLPAGGASPQLLFTSNSTSYQSILQSSSRNFRFIASKTNQKPSVIVTATLESHISASVACARKYGINLRTRSGGHDYEAMSYVSDSTEPLVVVDLAAMRSVKVNVASRRAWVQAGATLGELYYAVFKKSGGKLGFPAGICPTVGVGGHFGGGGLGTLSRKYGTAADNVVDATVVDVDGRVLDRAAMGEDMFWAIRGGGAASFGVVVAYKVRLVEVPPLVVAFNVNRNLKQNATKLVTRWQEVAPNFDKNLFMRIVAQTNGGSDGGNVGIQAVFNSLFLGNRSQLFTVMAKSFPELGLRAEDCTEMNWLESVLFFNGMLDQGVESLLNRTSVPGVSFKAKSDYVTEPIGEQGWDKIWRFLMENKEEPLTMILEPYGGILSEISETATPFPHRKGNLYNIQYYLWWMDQAGDAAVTRKHLEWMRKMYGFMAPFVSSNPRAAYYNYKDIDLGRNGAVASYAEARAWGDKYFKNNFRRLAAVKGRVDPHNFFRNEQSVPPLL